MKYIKQVLDILCSLGPYEKSRLYEVIALKYRYKSASVRVKHYNKAKKYGFIKGTELIIPNCNKCIFFISPEKCRQESLKLIESSVGSEYAEKLSTLPNYILRPYAILLSQVTGVINNVKRLSEISGNKLLKQALSSAIHKELKKHQFTCLSRI